MIITVVMMMVRIMLMVRMMVSDDFHNDYDAADGDDDGVRWL